MKLDAAVGYIHPGHYPASFGDSLMAMLQRYQLAARISLKASPRIATARNDVCRAFLNKTDARWLWMVDSDMVFEPDTLARLIGAASDEAPVVGGLCFGLDDSGEVFPAMHERVDGALIRAETYEENTLQRVDATGAACLLIHRDVLLKVGARGGVHPWFQETVEADWEYGEDVTFCLRCQEAGFPVHVHTGIEVGHEKTRILTSKDYQGGDHVE